MDLATYRALRPEMGEVPDGTITAQIAIAVLSVDAASFAARADEAIMLLASHNIATSPGGEMARLVAKDGSTVYWKQFQRLQDEAGALLARVP